MPWCPMRMQQRRQHAAALCAHTDSIGKRARERVCLLAGQHLPLHARPAVQTCLHQAHEAKCQCAVLLPERILQCFHQPPQVRLAQPHLAMLCGAGQAGDSRLSLSPTSERYGEAAWQSGATRPRLIHASWWRVEWDAAAQWDAAASGPVGQSASAALHHTIPHPAWQARACPGTAGSSAGIV